MTTSAVATSPASAGPGLPASAHLGTVLALLASGLQVVAAFHRWHPGTGAVALDVPLASAEASLVSFGAVLLVLAAVAALAALATPHGWPRLLSAVGSGGLVLGWVALGPVGALAGGVWLAAGAVCGHLVAAALAP